MTQRKLTRREMTIRLASVSAEYQRAMDEVASRPNGNGFASQDEMRLAVVGLYGPTVASLEAKLGGYGQAKKPKAFAWNP